MADHAHAHMPRLTRNQSLVMDTLAQSHGPLSAYSILDKLREEGLRAPLQVYRALEKLVDFGLVHRLESLNAFVACQHPDCQGHQTLAFAICDQCGQVEEINDEAITDSIRAVSSNSGFVATRAAIELRGICQACRK